MKIESLAGEIHGEENENSSPRRKTRGTEQASEYVVKDSWRKHNFEDGETVITDIRQGVKNPNRANIFVNGKYSFSLDIAQIVDLGVKIGRKLSEDELAELKRASEFGKLYQRTLEWVLTRPHSVKETRDYLRRKIYDKKLDAGFMDLIIERLMEKKYLDDRKFAEYYAENRFVKKGISQKRLKMELVKKGVAADIVEEAIVTSGRDEVEEARKIIAKKRGRYDDEKLMAYLCRQGFPYQLVRSLIQDSETD